MFLYGVTIFVLIALLFSMWKDNRSLWNPALLVIEVLFLYLSIANLFFSFGYENAHLVMIVGILLIPVLILLSGLFLIVNGFILLKKEGFSKANLLSPIMGIVILLFFVFNPLKQYQQGYLKYGGLIHRRLKCGLLPQRFLTYPYAPWFSQVKNLQSKNGQMRCPMHIMP